MPKLRGRADSTFCLRCTRRMLKYGAEVAIIFKASTQNLLQSTAAVWDYRLQLEFHQRGCVVLQSPAISLFTEVKAVSCWLPGASIPIQWLIQACTGTLCKAFVSQYNVFKPVSLNRRAPALLMSPSFSVCLLKEHLFLAGSQIFSSPFSFYLSTVHKSCSLFFSRNLHLFRPRDITAWLAMGMAGHWRSGLYGLLNDRWWPFACSHKQKYLNVQVRFIVPIRQEHTHKNMYTNELLSA